MQKDLPSVIFIILHSTFTLYPVLDKIRKKVSFNAEH